MLYFSKLKLVIIYCIIIFLSLFAFANFIENKENFVLSKKVNLGLDLQGGSYLLLEVDSQPIIDRSLQEKLLQLRKYFKTNKIKYKNLKLKDEAINFHLSENDIERFEDFFLNKKRKLLVVFRGINTGYYNSKKISSIKIEKFSKEHKLKMATISDLISYRRKKEKIIERTLKTKIRSKYGGDFNLIVYKNKIVPAEHIALVKGKINPKKPVLVRVHALNFLTDILGTSSFMDNQIKKSMQLISKKKNGVVVIIREPRSWTLSQRIKSDSDDKKSSQLRDYGVGAQILIDLGVKNMILISNSKKTIVGLEGYGLKVINRIPIKWNQK